MSRFRKIEEFTGTSKYKLLPFNFEALEDQTILVTNLVGEYLIIPRDTLERLVNHKLTIEDEHYTKLRSHHFIMEEEDHATIELLSLKTRTKYSGLRNFTNLHIFVVSLRCDHSCQYCQVSRQSEDKNAFDMTQDTANKSLDLVFKSPNKAIKIEFQGGEPLLNFDLIQYIVLEAKKRNLTENRDLQFVITTTLSLITDEMLNFCRDHKIHLSSSLDGPERLHNKHRPKPDRDSYELFVSGLEKARDIIGFDAISALMTTSNNSLNHVEEIIDEYLKLGFKGIFLRHLSPYGFALKTKGYQAYDSIAWLEFYRKGLDYILELNKSGIDFSEQYSTILLTKMLSSNNPGFVDLMNPSGAGISAVVFNYDGDVYASDESRMLKEMGDSTFKLGNVKTHTYQEIFTNESLLDTLENSFTLSAPMCNTCAFEPWCGADPVFHHAIFGDVLGRKPESDFCKRVKGVSSYLLHKMQDKETKAVFMKWVYKC
jgi:His-Xaa-Ser system radical SAM maturase HxsB